MLQTLVTCLVLLAGAVSQPKSYEGYLVLRTASLDTASVRALESLGNVASDEWDFLRGPMVGQPSDILVRHDNALQLQAFLDAHNIPFSVAVDNVQRLLDIDRLQQINQHSTGESISFHRFLTLTEIHSYLDDLAARYPNIASVQSIGSSLEGRDLKLIKISSGGQPKPAIFIDSAIHAVEWISPPVALYTIQQLVENYTANQGLVDSVDWYILPVLNPDGYEYTHTTDRLWRKNRARNGNSICRGVDPNRNFGFHWGGPGSSSWVCSPSYAGQSAFSERESAAVAAFLSAHRSSIQLYLAIHSYGNLLMYPWAHTNELPEDADELQALGEAAVNALEAVRGTRYQVGSSSNLLYHASGAGPDWAKGELGIKYTYTLELPNGGLLGFNPPTRDILPVVTETFEAIKVMGHFIGAQTKEQGSAPN